MVSRWLSRSTTNGKRFEEWQRQNPSKPFKEFFAESVVSKLAKGRAHKSLGGNLQDGIFGRSGGKNIQAVDKIWAQIERYVCRLWLRNTAHRYSRY